MEGSEFATQEQFLVVAQKRENLTKLNVPKVLGRIYKIAELRQLAEKLQLRNVDETIKGLGVNKTYSLAEIISKKSNPKAIGDALAEIDHNFYFPFVTYLKFPDNDVFKSSTTLLEKLSDNGLTLENNYTKVSNGITSPPTRELTVESIKLDDFDSSVSILSSCTRIIMSPNSNSTAYENCFVCRIPAVIKFNFERRLIELSLPYFYEPLAGPMRVTSDHPARFQQIFNELTGYLVAMIDSIPAAIDFERAILHLEVNCGAVDMGWQIEPQESASFDLKQNVVPLKQIFESFTSTLKIECDALGKDNPLEKINLYDIFRALKEQGYTCQMVQSAPLGAKGGKVSLSLMNGDRDSSPPVLFLSDRSYEIMKNLRYEIWRSQQVKTVNPYIISNVLPKSPINILPPIIPHDQIGVDKLSCDTIADAITKTLNEKPDKPLSVQKIVTLSQSTGDQVKKVFYYLLYDGYFKATYIAYHKTCNKPLSLMKNSLFEAEKSIENHKTCMSCSRDIEKEEVENRMIFWGNDANINA